MRRRRAEKREARKDPKYNSPLIGKFINMIMLQGKKSKAETLFDIVMQRSRQEYVEPINIFFIHLFRGDHDQALEWLERACEERDSWLLFARNFPIESYRIPDEPRFNAVLKKYGLK